MVIALLTCLALSGRAAAQNLMNGGAFFPYQQGAPGEPGSSGRPGNWPGANGTGAPQTIKKAPPRAGGQPGGPIPGSDEQSMKFDLLDLEGARIIARVGPEVIQDNEVSSFVNDIIEQNASRIPPNQLEKVREKLTKDRLNHLVEIKLALVDAQRKVPTDAYPKIVDSIGTEFETKEVKRKLKQLNLATRGDLEAKLHARGTSLEREKQAFIEQQLALGWIAQQTKTKHEATHEDMLAYYLEHIEDYSFGAVARWEELRIRVAGYPTRLAAQLALGQLVNDVLRGANFADVARARSQGPTASVGGQYDWTTQGSLALDVLDQALFTLPIGQMSPILDDGRSPTISIIRVLERKEAGRQPFTEVQAEIKEKLAAAHQEKDRAKLHEYVEKLRAETPIWTIFDEPGKSDPNLATRQVDGPAANTSMRPSTPPADPKQPVNPYLR